MLVWFDWLFVWNTFDGCLLVIWCCLVFLDPCELLATRGCILGCFGWCLFVGGLFIACWYTLVVCCLGLFRWCLLFLSGLLVLIVFGWFLWLSLCVVCILVCDWLVMPLLMLMFRFVFSWVYCFCWLFRLFCLFCFGWWLQEVVVELCVVVIHLLWWFPLI